MCYTSVTKGLSTYDYIIMQREKEEGRHFKEDASSYRKRKRVCKMYAVRIHYKFTNTHIHKYLMKIKKNLGLNVQE